MLLNLRSILDNAIRLLEHYLQEDSNSVDGMLMDNCHSTSDLRHLYTRDRTPCGHPPLVPVSPHLPGKHKNCQYWLYIGLSKWFQVEDCFKEKVPPIVLFLAKTEVIIALSFKTLWAYSADIKLVIFFLFFSENKTWNFKQIVSTKDN